MAGATPAVRIKGLNELRMAFKEMDAALYRELGKELKQVAEVVAVDARRRFSVVDHHSASGYKPRLHGKRGVSVDQTLRKVTGKRGDYGALQMRRALIPALQSHESELVSGVERMLDRLEREHGF